MLPDVATTMIDTPCHTSSRSGCGVSVSGEFHVVISDGAYLHGNSDRALGIVHWVLDCQQAQGSCQTAWKTDCPQMRRLISSPDESIHGVEVIIDAHTSLGALGRVRGWGGHTADVVGRRSAVETVLSLGVHLHILAHLTGSYEAQLSAHTRGTLAHAEHPLGCTCTNPAELWSPICILGSLGHRRDTISLRYCSVLICATQHSHPHHSRS